MKVSEHRLALAMANYGTEWYYIDDDNGMRYMTIRYQEQNRGRLDWAWYVSRPGEELGPFATRFEAACVAMRAGWMPKSFLQGAGP